MAPLFFLLFIIFIASSAIVPVRSTKQTILTGSEGGSISIPCFYGQEHKDLVKSWCKGRHKLSCSPETRSDSPLGTNRVSITDDPQNLVFIVTMRNLQKSDEGRYWCAVGDGWRHKAASDEEYKLISTTEERSSTLKTFSYLRGQTGGSITIPCFYGQEHKHHVKYWCKSGNRPPCTSTTKATQTIADDPDNLVFLVTMTNLQQSDWGHYWCSVGEGRPKETSDSLFFLVTPNAQSVRTESWVPVWRGGSVTIACYYDQNYKDKPKYLCRGYDWDSCSRIAQSDGEQSRGTVSISDDRDQMMFNVTIRDLQEEDFDYYWCAVEASAAQSHRAFMPLIVREAIPVLTTQQTEQKHHTTLRNTVSSPFPLTSSSTEQSVTNSDVRSGTDQKQEQRKHGCPQSIVPVRSSKQTILTGSEGGSISIPCFYGQEHKDLVKSWCKGDSLRSCSPETCSDSPLGTNRVSITDDPQNLVFIVTMRNLQKSDEGSYWCAVDDGLIHKAASDEEYMLITTAIVPVRSFKQTTLRGSAGGSISIPCFYGQQYKHSVKSWCKGTYGSSCSPETHSDRVSITDDPQNLVFIVTMRDLQESDEGSYWCAVGHGLIHKATSDEEYMLITTAEERSSTLKTFSYLRGQTGGCITIPCFYGQEHKNRVKYWCKSGNRPPCTSATKATQTKGTIADDPDNLVFLVTMTNLQQSDWGHYWCSVGEERTKETSDSLFFLVTPNAQSVRTESWISAWRGGSVTIPCYYDQNYKDKPKYFCRGYDWDSCSRIAQSDGEQSRGTVSVSDDRDQMVFNVTIRDLQEEDFDYYWCAVEASAAQSHRAYMPLIVREAKMSVPEGASV